jgi:hypothetical protein
LGRLSFDQRRNQQVGVNKHSGHSTEGLIKRFLGACLFTGRFDFGIDFTFGHLVETDSLAS